MAIPEAMRANPLPSSSIHPLPSIFTLLSLFALQLHQPHLIHSLTKHTVSMILIKSAYYLGTITADHIPTPYVSATITFA